MLKLSDNLDLPLDFVTERIAFLARTGAGKSGGMRVMFEQIFDAGQFAIFIDPKGDAYGIRAEGIGEGKPVLVMGGDHGDVPLEASAGKVIAEFLVRERVSTVLDISDFGKADMVRFVTDLCRTLYQRNRDVVHIFIDEADMVAGEKFYDPKCLEAIQLIQNKGRHRGFGVTVATQRSAMINKSVLFASGTLIAMQTTSPKDIDTVRGWLEVCSTKEIAKEIVAELPTLKTREAIVYSPQLLDEPVRITFSEFQTFDSMRTPKPGELRQQPKSLADIDLSAVQRDMAATIEKVKADDPKTLRAEITKLKREVEQAQAAASVQTITETLEVPVPVLDEEKLTELQGVLNDYRRNLNIKIEAFQDTLRAALDEFTSLDDPAGLNGYPIDRLLGELRNTKPTLPASLNKSPVPKQPIARSSPSFERPKQAMPQKLLGNMTKNITNNGNLPEGERKVLTAIAQYSDRGGCDREQVGVLSGYKRSSRDTYISRLSQKGLIELGPQLFATDDGIAALGDFEPLPTGTVLQEYWLMRLPAGESKILQVLIERYDEVVTREIIGNESGYLRSSRDTYISRLSTRKLVEIRSGGVKASDNLFD